MFRSLILIAMFSLAVKSFHLPGSRQQFVARRLIRTFDRKIDETLSSPKPTVKSKSSLLHYKQSLLRKVMDKKKVINEEEPIIISTKKIDNEVQTVVVTKKKAINEETDNRDNIMHSEPIANSETFENSHISNALFSSLDISANTLKAIATHFKYSNMTVVQSECIPPILSGKDAMVKAKTGTGKTIGFLIPAIEALLKEKIKYTKISRSIERGSDQGAFGKSIDKKPMVVILSPTRELALQIATEAKILLKYQENMNVVTLVGGTNVDTDRKILTRREGVDIIVATPGRMMDHLETTPQLKTMIKGTKVFILDEADRMLDMGFDVAVKKITSYFQDTTNRQTLLFSATFNKEIREVATKSLQPGYISIDTVGEEGEQTHSHVKQEMYSIPVKQHIPQLLSILLHNINNIKNYKIMVFFPTAKQTSYMSRLFQSIGINVFEMHSGKSQSYRTNTSGKFKNAKNGIMFSSDVTARGLDYPDVTSVIQVGITSRDSYIHRLGRTARAGKEGKGTTILAPYEVQSLAKDLADIPLIHIDNDMANKEISLMQGNLIMNKLESSQRLMLDDASVAWASWLGHYNSYCKKLKWNGSDLLKASQEYALSLGLSKIPPLPIRTLGKMGLKGVPGFTSAPDLPRRPRPGSSSSRAPKSTRK